MLYILLPIYNEERIIENVVTELRTFLKKRKYHIVAVDDGSTDSTGKILKRIAKKDLSIVTYGINMNIGSVFATGIDAVLQSATDSDILVIMESDQTSSAETIDSLVSGIEKGNDVVIASRYLTGGGYGNFPASRRLFSIGASTLMRYFFPIGTVKDYTIFFRAYRIGMLRKAIGAYGKYGLIQSKGFVANAELLVKLSFLTKRISEVPFLYDYGKKTGKSKIRIGKTINEYFVAITYLSQIRKKLSQRHIRIS